jgi:hypothetical protein
MIVVFDTNIWKSQVYLQSSQAAAVRFFLRQKSAKVGLPEVIKREVDSHVRRDIRSLIHSIRGDHQRLLGIFGKLKEVVLPSDTEVNSVVTQIFESVGVEIVEVPFSFASAQASFSKIVEQQPPSDKDQQFKDGVIWADCIHLLKFDDVVLVTNDRAFYDNRDFSKGLAANLQLETSRALHQLTILPELVALLDQIRSPVSLDDDLLASLWMEKQHESVASLVSDNGFEIGGRSATVKKMFATEDPRILFVQFTAEFTCPSFSLDREPAMLRIGGDCRYNTETGQFDQFSPQTEELTFRLPDGTEAKKGVAFMSAHIVMGHKDVSHSVRFDLAAKGLAT